jgi:hypothetical protein
MGVTAHVYGDTFSHYGFSGVSSRRNKVINDSIQFDSGLDPDIKDYIQGKAEVFFRKNGIHGGVFSNIKSWLAETVSGALGHGAVATFPDRPYLKWEFDYEKPKAHEKRNNPKDFLDACKALHAMFTKFAKGNPDHSAGDGVEFSAIKDKVVDIINFQGAKMNRVKQWKSAASKGELFKKKFKIPEYNAEHWLREAQRMNSRDSVKALESHLYRFYQAASLHRQYVLRELLPAHDLVVA